MIAAEPFESRLVSSRMLTPFVRELVLERTDEPLQFEAGQWVNLVLPMPDGEIKRAYSIASAPDPSGSPRYELAVTRVTGGPGSQLLHALPEGSTLRTIGPQGLFVRRGVEDAPSLFIATGTGLTPFRSMIREAVAAGRTAPLWLLFGARLEEDILYRDELESLAREHPFVRYDITLSRPGPSWQGRRGWVQEHVPELLAALQGASAPAEPHAYVCGLERMVATVRDLLRHQLGVNRKHVHTERYD